MITGFEIRRGRTGTGMCMWGDCDPDVPERRDAGRAAGFVNVVILDRESFPACRRHRREVEEILCSLLPDTAPELEAAA